MCVFSNGSDGVWLRLLAARSHLHRHSSVFFFVEKKENIHCDAAGDQFVYIYCHGGAKS